MTHFTSVAVALLGVLAIVLVVVGDGVSPANQAVLGVVLVLCGAELWKHER